MDLQNIRIFVLCTRYLSFSKVAELTYSSQSSVSKAIAALEADVGGQLFLRSTRKIELTSFGEALLPYAEALLSKEDELKGFLHQYHTGQTVRPLVIGVAKFLTATPMDGLLLPLTDAIDRMRRLHEEVDIKVAYFEDQNLQSLLNSGRIDIAITAINNKHLQKQIFSGADFQRLNEVDNYLLFAPGEQEAKSVGDVLPHLDRLFSVSDQIALSVSFDFLQQVRTPIPLETCDNWTEIVSKIRNGQGGTILGETTACLAMQCGLSSFSLHEYGITSSMVAVWKHGVNPLLEELAVLLRNTFSAH